MAELPIMPVNWQSLISDTTHMTDAEFGAYVRILGAIWLHGGRIPYDDERLRKIAGTPPRRWRAIKLTVLQPLTITEGTVSQKRLTDTLLRVREMRARRVTASHKANKHRWRQFGPNVRPFGPTKPLK